MALIKIETRAVGDSGPTCDTCRHIQINSEGEVLNSCSALHNQRSATLKDPARPTGNTDKATVDLDKNWCALYES